MQTAAASREISSATAAVNFVLSIREKSRISSFESRCGISRKQESPSFADCGTAASDMGQYPRARIRRSGKCSVTLLPRKAERADGRRAGGDLDSNQLGRPGSETGIGPERSHQYFIWSLLVRAYFAVSCRTAPIQSSM